MAASDNRTDLSAGSNSNLKNDPKSVNIDITGGTGVEIVWKDLHRSAYSFVYCATRVLVRFAMTNARKANRAPGEPPKLAPGALPMFKEKARPTPR